MLVFDGKFGITHIAIVEGVTTRTHKPPKRGKESFCFGGCIEFLAN